ncbi:MAG: sodium:solute symporter family protein [Candidatus Latescibacterota bacterium]|nr:MAG: sodium:solute symporter family protein [Candidatus Latescibacterota bacterium]
MNMAVVDWLILVGALTFLVSGVFITRKYMQSVADFLVAGRTAGRYILSLSQGIAGLGAISIVGLLEMNYIAGFSMSWWGITMSVVVLVITVTGWVIYRFRQTRSLTLPEFFEKRYSRKFRIFAGMLAFASGLVNFGIFPAVVARFFIYYCGLPDSIPVAGIEISVFPLTMIVLLSIALFFVYSGGQVAVIITDFVQGVFVNLVFVAVTLYLMFQVDWTQILEALATAPQDASLINPFKTSHVEDFNLWYFLIGVVVVIYGAMSWQGTQAYNASAKSAHEAKMGAVLNNWRGFPQNLLLLFVPIIAYTVMNHADFAANAAHVNGILDGLDSKPIQAQLRVPLVLTTLLPVGLLGAFAAVMLAAFISTHDTYLHSWGSIFVQDVIIPFRKKPLTQRQHLRILRLSIAGVAVFIFFFSLLFRQAEYIFLFFAITGAIFFGGCGAVLIGGLYWKHGTTPAAWTAMITGSSIAVGGIVTHQLVDDFFINGQMFTGISIGAACLVYVLVSLLGKREVHDLDKLLHRGAHAIKEEYRVIDEAPSRGLRMLAIGKEFTKTDKIIYFASYAWTFSWTVVFVIGTIYNLHHEVDDTGWAEFWKIYIYIQIALSLFVIVWFLIGGANDVRKMLRALRTMKRDPSDDGIVRQDVALSEPPTEEDDDTRSRS